MLTTLVTYERPEAAEAMCRHLLEEPGTGTLVVVDNGGFMESAAPFRIAQAGLVDNFNVAILAHQEDPLWVRFTAEAVHGRTLFVIWPDGKNLGAGGGRNEALRYRKPSEPFIRIDDDWLPDHHGWLEVMAGASARTRAPLIRLNPALACGPTIPLMPDAAGPIWYVSGAVADELGFFYQGFGKSLLDDLEYSRRVVAWAKRRRVPPLINLDWRVSDLCAMQRPWNPPWDLFLERCALIERSDFDLHVPFEQEVGIEWTRRGLPIKETK